MNALKTVDVVVAGSVLGFVLTCPTIRQGKGLVRR